ncbi:MAG TPA: hypothetical protein VGN63_17795 [Flavisolibacter sp.]|jgi:hypothetical protein|nr:hypothetical protein [Flavisolibacter sp.]
MRKLTTTFSLCILLSPCFGQAQRGVSLQLQAQYNKTLYDYTAGNNPWSLGLGLQAFLQNRSRFKPTMELTGDLYLEDDKVFRSNPDGSFPENSNRVDGMVNLFAGSTFHATQGLYLSLLAGPSFISGKTLWGIKPSLGFSISGNKKWTGKLSYINVFSRTKIVDEDFGSLSFAIGVRLF